MSVTHTTDHDADDAMQFEKTSRRAGTSREKDLGGGKVRNPVVAWQAWESNVSE